MVEFENDWPDIIAFLVSLLSFFVAIVSGNRVFGFVIVFLVGLIFGRMWFRFRSESRVSLVIVMLGALLGFLIALFFNNPHLVVILFLVGVAFGFWVHEKGFIKSVEF